MVAAQPLAVAKAWIRCLRFGSVIALTGHTRSRLPSKTVQYFFSSIRSRMCVASASMRRSLSAIPRKRDKSETSILSDRVLV